MYKIFQNHCTINRYKYTLLEQRGKFNFLLNLQIKKKMYIYRDRGTNKKLLTYSKNDTYNKKLEWYFKKTQPFFFLTQMQNCGTRENITFSFQHRDLIISIWNKREMRRKPSRCRKGYTKLFFKDFDSTQQHDGTFILIRIVIQEPTEKL